MKKNTFTFRHDYGARNDPKIRKVLNKIGPDGGFIFWVIVEMLYEQGGYIPRDSYDEIAHDNYTDTDTVKRVVEEFGLFEFDKERIWSNKVLEQLSEREIKADKAKKSANSRWEKEDSGCERNPNAMQTQCDGNAKKEIKGNNSNSIASIPSKDSIEACPPQDGRTQEPLLEFEGKAEDKEILNQDGKAQESAVLTPKQCQQVVDFWNRTIDETKAALPKVKTLGEDRMKKIRVRWKEFSEIGDPVEVTRQVFRNACGSKFFQGDNHNGWSGSFDWIFTNSKNWAKVYEGNYNDNKGVEAQPQEQQKPKKTYKSIQDLAADQGWS